MLVAKWGKGRQHIWERKNMVSVSGDAGFKFYRSHHLADVRRPGYINADANFLDCEM